MSATIDERVVEMRFDNAQFERNVQTSMSTLDRLKKSLDLDGAAKGFENLDSAAKKVDMSGLSSAVETVHAKFSAFEVIAVTALANITNSAINTGKQLLASLTVDQVSAGWSKYGEKVSAVQTIMNATGKDIDEVSAALDKLSWFTDETSYSFTDMVSNIGKFTSQGIDLDTAVTAMEGISTWAALSGGNVNEASRAMYNLSQAIGVGAVKLQDWKSIENANMATKEFKEQAMEAAVSVGTLTKTADGLYQTLDGKEVNVANFSSTLQEAWFTADALTAVLSNYGGYADGLNEVYDALSELGDGYSKTTSEIISDMKELQGADDDTILSYGYTKELIPLVRELSNSVGDVGQRSFAAAQEAKTFTEALDSVKDAVASGWMNTFELIFGNYEEAKELWTDLANAMYDAFAEGGNARNELLAEWKDFGSSDVISFLSDIQGYSTEAFEELQRLGKESGYTSNEFKELASSLLGGNDAMAASVGNMLKMEASGKDVISYISDLTGMTRESVAELQALGQESGYNSKAFKELASTLAEGDAEMQSTITSLLQMANSGKSAGEYIVGLTGLTEENVEQLKALGKESGYTSEEYKKLVSSLGEGDEAMESAITHMLKLSDSGEDVVSYISDLTGMTEDSVEELHRLGKELGYNSDEFRELASTLAEGDDVMETTITNLLKMTDAADQLTGRETLIQAFWNIWEAIGSVIAPIKDAFRDIFPATTAEQLYNITKGLMTFTEKLKLSEKTSANLRSTFKGLFAVLDIVKQAFSAIFHAITPLFSGLGTLSGGILSVTGSMGEWLASLDEFIKKNDIFGKVINGVVGFIVKAFNALKEFATFIKEAFHLPSFDEMKESLKGFLNLAKEKISVPGLELIHTILERIHDRLSQVGQATGSMKTGVAKAISAIGDALSKCKFLDLLGAIWNMIQKVVGGITNALGGAFTFLIDKLSNADFNGLIDFFNSLALGGLALGINGGISGFFDNLVESVTGTPKKITNPSQQITGILDGVKDCLSSFQKDLQAKTLLKIAEAIALLAASIFVISMIDSEKLSASLGAITVLFADLVASMAVFNKLDGVKSKGATGLVVFAAAILVLSSAVKKLASLDPGAMAAGLVGVGVLLAELDAFMATAKFSKGTMSTATGMVIMAAAIKILAGVVSDMAQLRWDEMAKGLVGVGVLLAEVDIFLNTAKMSGKAVLTATGIVILASALKILASVCKTFATMSWGEISKGLAAVGALLLEVTAFTKLSGNAKHVISTGLALIEIAAAIKIFASAMKDFAQFSWEEIAKGLTAMGGALAEVTIALKLMPKNMVGIGTGLVIVGAALKIIAGVLGKFGKFSWEEIAKGLVALGGALAELSIALNLMKGTLGGSAALLVAANALLIMTPVLSILGAMSWEGIAKGLIVLAGAFTIIGVAGALLKPLVVTILALSGAFALIGVGVLAIGAGLMAAGLGLSAIAVGFTALAAALAGGVTAVVAALTVIVTEIAGLIPVIVQKIGEAIIAFCKVIAEGAPAIGEAVKAIVLTLVDVLVECVPAIVDGVFKMVTEVLKTLVSYTPTIVDSLFQFLIAILEGIAKNLPALIQAAIDVLMAFFSGIVDALKGIDTEALLEGIVGIGLLAGIMAALSAVAGLVPGAMAGVLGMGAVLAELALVLAAIGALAQIPGLEWLISEGGDFLQAVGTAIGQFIGGIVGGIAEGISSALPQIGTDLSTFMANIQPFIEGAKMIDPAMLEGVRSLVEVILLLTAADLLEGLTSWLTGGSSLSDFADDLVPFGSAMKDYSDAISGINPETVTASATAAKALAEMAANLPNSGGVVSWFTGENDMDQFAAQLVPFGEAMKEYSNAVAGIDAASIESSAIAGKALTELANTVPNTGGVVSWFAGNNDLGAFAEQIIPFGEAMKLYGDSVQGIDGATIEASAIAGKALTELANTVPNTGGVVSWFTGNNDLDTFGEQIVPFGKAMKEYGDAVAGIDAEAVTASATAGLALTELANTVPNTGGVVSWFTGNNDLDTFGDQIVVFGKAMKSYGDSVAGIDAEAVSASATAGLALAQLANILPNTGGIASWFAGDNDLGTFAEGLIPFGAAMKSYGDAVSGIDTAAVTASATAAQSLATLEANLPAIGGLTELFSGGNSLGQFAEELIPFGAAMKSYGDAVSGIDTEAINASAIAAQSLAKLESDLPAIGGLAELFTGGNSLSQFAEELIPFGAAMKSYSDAVSGINPEAVTASATAAQSLSELEANLPDVGGISGWITGESDLGDFAERLIPFGAAMLSYSQAIDGIDPEAVTASATAAQALSTLEANLPATGGVVSWFTGDNDLANFGAGLIPFGEAMKSYSLAVAGINAEAVVDSATAGSALVELAKTLPNTGGVVSWFTGDNDLGSFATNITPFGEAMRDYSLAVEGLNAEAVVNSTVAGSALVELAKTLPNTGGVVEFFTGGNDIGKFGETIVPFGKAMKEYSDAVTGIDAEAIVNSATAGSSLVELSKTLPNTGGVVSWFTGDNDLETFGATIIVFGKAMKDYSDSIAEIDGEAITNSALAGKALVELANTLPKAGGIVSWFTGDTDMGDFGKSLVSFGNSMKQYSASIYGINVESLSGVVTETGRLIELAKGMSGLDTKGMTNFGPALTKVGEAGVTGFISAFTDSTSKVQTAATQMLTNFINSANAQKSNLTTTFTTLMQSVITGINAKQTDFQMSGSTLMIKFMEGIRLKDAEIKQMFTVMVGSYLTIIRNKYVEFITVGTECMVKFIAGLRSKDAAVRSVFTVLLSACITIIKNYYNEFYSTGSYLVDGFCNGISENTWKAEARARAMAAAAARAAKQELDEHSPSKVGYQIGDFFGVAFVNAIGDYEQKAYNASANMAKAAKTGLGNAISKVKDFITDGIDAQPTIRPVLDLTNVESGARKLNTMFSQTQALSVASRFNEGRDVTIQNGESTTNSQAGNNITFTQNNYSPKALSRVEIYRQTKNQLSVMKEALT